MAGEFIPLNLGADWIAKIWGRLQRIKNKRKDELEAINQVGGKPTDLAKYYIEPDCQDTNPADSEVEDLLDNHLPVITKIDEFLAATAPSHPGYNVLFVLGDAGMGKTALLTMIKLMHLTSFWPNGKECALKKLHPGVLDEIKQIGNQFKTILLLDSLDEDSSAYGRVKDRLIEILNATQNFHRIIITCRTQFFPDSEGDRFERFNRVVIGGYRCRVKYLSFFGDKHVQAYLKKRFPKRYKIFPQKKLLEDALETIKKMGSLRCRPMLLAYIDNLMPSAELRTESNEFVVYNALVNNWLQREHAKTKVPANDLLRACEILATELTMNKAFSISEQQVDDLIKQYSEIRHIQAIDIKGRSLLNRNSEGEYRFAHNSFREFLVARRVLIDHNWKPDQRIPTTELMFSFLTNRTFLPQQAVRFQLLDLSFLKTHTMDLSGAYLSDANLSGANLSDANLSGANLSGANLSDAILIRANLSGANLSDANLIRANLSGADLSGADLSGANFNRANLIRTNLSSADLRDADLSGANLSGANLIRANLSEAILSETILYETILYEANLSDAILSDAIVSCAYLNGANLRGADLSATNFRGADLRGADLREAIVSLNQFNDMKSMGIDISAVRIKE